MEFPAHIVFSCLLVCQPAIFVDSKRDGIRAAQRQKGLQDGYFGCYGEGQRPRGRDWLGSMPSATVSHRVTAWSLRGIAMQPKDTEECRRAIDRVNRAYADEDYDRYERLIERYCHRFGFDGDYSLFEDACTDARIFGHGIG